MNHADVLRTIVLPEYGTDPYKFSVEREAINAALDAMECWQFCVKRNIMPVMEGNGDRWYLSVPVTSNRHMLFHGKTPSDVVRAAINAVGETP